MALTKLKRKAEPSLSPNFMGFAGDEATHAALLRAAEAQGISDPVIARGNLADVVETLSGMPTPKRLVVDLGDSGDVISAIESLAEVCDEGTKVVAIGAVNDINLYHQLIGAGIQDYLVKPVNDDALGAALSRAEKEPEVAQPEEAKVGRLIAVVGARGGVGASTVAVNTAWLMAHEQGRRVALVDLDLYFGTCSLTLDLEPGRGFREALENPGRIDGLFMERAMIRESDRLFVLGTEESFENRFSFDPAALDLLLDTLRRDFDCVVLDMPRFAARTQIASLAPPASMVVVSDPSLAGVRDTARLVGFAKKAAPDVNLKVTVNRFGVAKDGELSKGDFEKGADIKIDHIIPFDAKPFAASDGTGKPLVKVGKNSKAVAALRELARGVAGQKQKAVQVSLWQRLLKGIK